MEENNEEQVKKRGRQPKDAETVPQEGGNTPQDKSDSYELPDFYKLAGVEAGQFPFRLLMDNKTPSTMAFPELREQPANMLKAYVTNIPVVFYNSTMVEYFADNLRNLADLFGWTAEFGVFVKGYEDGAD